MEGREEGRRVCSKCQGRRWDGNIEAGSFHAVRPSVTCVLCLPAVRTLNCEGLANTEDVLTAMSWVLDNHKKPAVVQMALTTQNVDMRMDEGAASLVAAGLPVVASAGNFNISEPSARAFPVFF